MSYTQRSQVCTEYETHCLHFYTLLLPFLTQWIRNSKVIASLVNLVSMITASQRKHLSAFYPAAPRKIAVFMSCLSNVVHAVWYRRLGTVWEYVGDVLSLLTFSLGHHGIWKYRQKQMLSLTCLDYIFFPKTQSLWYVHFIKVDRWVSIVFIATLTHNGLFFQ